MNEERAFLHAICAEPDEDTPRLAFADWLTERGGTVNTAWAEFIRVQIARDGASAPDRAQLRNRERELYWITEGTWAERMGLPTYARWSNWERGFPRALKDHYSGPDLSEFANALPIPLREVELIDVREVEFYEFLKWPGLRCVLDLDLWEVHRPFSAAVVALAECAHLHNLERLRMTQAHLTDEAAIALLESPHMGRLFHLSVGHWRSVSPSVEARLDDRFGGVALMDEEAAFLRAVCEQPDDDTLRLVFADWLDEQGGPVNVVWANAIRTQVRIDRGPVSRAGGRRAQAFQSSYAGIKVRERLGISHQLGVGDWVRGFPTAVGGTWSDLRVASQVLMFRAPIEKVNVFDGTPTAVAELAQWSGLPHLREFNLNASESRPLTEDDLLEVVRCDWLSGLEALSLGHVRLNDAGAEVLFESRG